MAVLLPATGPAPTPRALAGCGKLPSGVPLHGGLSLWQRGRLQLTSGDFHRHGSSCFQTFNVFQWQRRSCFWAIASLIGRSFSRCLRNRLLCDSPMRFTIRPFGYALKWALLRAVAADFFFNCWYLEIPSDSRIRHVPRCVYYHAQGFRLETF
jgi:hypothetical protein